MIFRDRQQLLINEGIDVNEIDELNNLRRELFIIFMNGQLLLRWEQCNIPTLILYDRCVS